MALSMRALHSPFSQFDRHLVGLKYRTSVWVDVCASTVGFIAPSASIFHWQSEIGRFRLKARQHIFRRPANGFHDV